MRHIAVWVGVGLLAIGVGLWAGTGEQAFVDSSGKVVPTVTAPRWMWVPAAVCISTTPGSVLDLPATNPAVAACATGTNTQKATLDFADASNLSAQFHYKLPATWTGNIDVNGKWFSGATGTAAVVWQFQTSCVADGETDDPSWDTDILAITDANKNTANQVNDFTGTLLTTSHLSGCAAGEILHVKVFRDSAHASDVLAATARLIGLEFVIYYNLTLP
jgi:hypothetical protein